jgi:PsbP-like protein
MVSSSGLRNVRVSSSMIVLAAVIILLIFPSNSNTNNNNDTTTLLQSKSVLAQLEEQGAGTTNATTITNDTTTTTANATDYFLPYSNPTYGIIMQYPSNWTASTSGLADYTDLIAFYSPLQNVSDSFPARLAISVITYGQNISLAEYTDSVLMILNQSEQFDVKSSSEVTVAGYPGYRVVLANQPPLQNGTLIFNQMNTWTTIGNKVYLLTYEGKELVFNRHLPEVSQMLQSLIIQQEI